MFSLYNFVIVILNCTKVSLIFISTLFETIIIYYGKTKKYFESATKLYKVKRPRSFFPFIQRVRNDGVSSFTSHQFL